MGRASDDGTHVTRAEVAPTTIRALEHIARGFDLTRGLANVRLTFENGLFSHAWLERRVTLKTLSEFEPVFRETADDPLPSELKATSE
jgi:hypothetical protein